jgi:hypothetical protein
VKAPGPLDELYAVAMSGASGEFICASATVEVHVYLQTGRLAWATDSTHAFAFARHLQDTAGIDRETFKQLSEECRREKQPLGETLVKWGLTTWEGVRSSLAHQIGLVIALLATMQDGQVIFLGRAYGRYDERLTFDVREFVDEAAFEESAPHAVQVAPRSTADGANGSSRPTAPTGPNLAHQLRGSIEGLSWVEILEADAVVDADPPAAERRTPAGLVQTTLMDGADFAAIRSARSSVVGLRLAGERSIWCHLSADSTFGGAVSAIWAVAGSGDRSPGRAPARPDVEAWSLSPEGPAGAAVAIRSFMERAPDVLGALVLSGTPDRRALAGCGSSALEPDKCLDTARRRVETLAQGELLVGDAEEQALVSIGFHTKTMVSGEAELWCFGAELEPEAGHTLWMFLDRRNSQGLGWAYLSALTRTLCQPVGAP